MRRACFILALLAAGCGGPGGPTDTGKKLQTSTTTYEVGTPEKGARSFVDALRYNDAQAVRALSTGPILELVDASGLEEVKSRLGQAIEAMQRESSWYAEGSAKRAEVLAKGYRLHVRLDGGTWRVKSITRGSEQVLP